MRRSLFAKTSRFGIPLQPLPFLRRHNVRDHLLHVQDLIRRIVTKNFDIRLVDKQRLTTAQDDGALNRSVNQVAKPSFTLSQPRLALLVLMSVSVEGLVDLLAFGGLYGDLLSVAPALPGENDNKTDE